MLERNDKPMRTRGDDGQCAVIAAAIRRRTLNDACVGNYFVVSIDFIVCGIGDRWYHLCAKV